MFQKNGFISYFIICLFVIHLRIIVSKLYYRSGGLYSEDWEISRADKEIIELRKEKFELQIKKLSREKIKKEF